MTTKSPEFLKAVNANIAVLYSSPRLREFIAKRKYYEREKARLEYNTQLHAMQTQMRSLIQRFLKCLLWVKIQKLEEVCPS